MTSMADLVKALSGVIVERDAALARAERAEKAIRDYLSGDYPNPRSHRPGKCEHGTNYWDECAACDCAHFEAALAHPAPTEET